MGVPSYRAAVTNPPQARRTEQAVYPAPIGMNTMSPIAGMTPEDCIYTYNLIPNELGMKTRSGYREWQTDLVGDIRTVVPFNGNAPSADRLFVAAQDGIYDATAQGVAGAPVYPWPSTGDASGYMVWTHFTNDASDHFLMGADEFNGLTEYEESTGLWTATAGVTGPDTTNVPFIMAHKNRLWMFEKDSSDAWYLPTGLKAGVATKFNFGSQFREGGALAGLYSWTVDGGDGVDDYMVALTREGGVAIYRGDDPANASTWALVGVWYIGRVPVGYRAASQYGGQLFILSEHGLISINALLQGTGMAEAALASTGKITRIIRENLAATLELRGWEIRQLPVEDLFIVNSPPRPGGQDISYVRNFTTNGWGLWRGLNIATADLFHGELYFAGTDLKDLQVMAGSLDGVLLDNTEGVDIEFSILTSYQGFGPFKVGQFCRPYFISSGLPNFSVQARYDFDVAENDGGVDFKAVSLALWDEGLWDQAKWAGGADSYNAIRGISGYGHAIAIALRGTARLRATLTAIEVQTTQGGML